ncbi:MAG TPA: response regulator [Thermoanaerobaculia bacterium]|nr:response regulator [Thermoanaerobaculia bacterium]
MKFHDLSIRNKLIGIILLTTTVSLACGFVLVILRDIRTFKRDLIESTVVLAKVTGENSVSALAFDDREDAAKTLAKLSSLPTITGAYLFNSHGKLLAEYRHGTSRRTDPPGPSEGLRKFLGEELLVSERIVYQGENYGTIYLKASIAPMRDKIRTDLLTMVVVMILAILVSLILALRLEKIISRPILDLARVAREISEHHDYRLRFEKSSSDEVGVLSDGFNDMLVQIERRQRERDEANERTREKSQFLANMSHELRTPLNAIIGFSEILRTRFSDRLNDKELKFVDNIHTSGQHLLGIVNDILDLSKIEAGRMEIHPELFSVPTAIEGVCNLMKGFSSRRNIAFVIDAGPLPELHADPVKFKQILYNLISNAVKFSPDHSVVRIEAREVGAEDSPVGEQAVAVAVIDQGIGIDPGDHELIFREFQQVDATAARNFEGTGLGLSLVRKMVEMHKGSVVVKSTLGQGSTFIVTFPLDYRGVQKSTAPFHDLTEASPNLSILVVEDDLEAFENIRRHLHRAGYATIWARTGEEALSIARVSHPAAITLDVVLPGIDGWEVLKMLKSDPATWHIPIIMVSTLDNRELGMALGVDDYLIKPVNSNQLLDVLGQLVISTSSESTLLVIDDDAELHEMLETKLAPLGTRIEYATSGAEGIALALAAPPSLVILDLMMENMDGFEVAARLRSHPATSHVPILVLTARDLTNSDRGRLRGKIEAIVKKGDVSAARIVGVVQELIERHHRSSSEAAPQTPRPVSRIGEVGS